MKTLLRLVVQQARDNRAALVVAPLASAVVLGGVFAWFPGPNAVGEATAYAIGALTALWTLYFAADSFASDGATGRLATLALLPVRARTLWSSRVAFVALTSFGQGLFALGFGLGLHATLGSTDSFEACIDGLRPMWPWLPSLAVIAAAAMVASLVVETALAAMIGSLLALGAIGLAAAPAVRALAIVGVDVTPALRNGVLLQVLLALAFLALGAHTFVRGQRRLGSRSVRAWQATWPVLATLTLGGLASAAEYSRRTAVELENPRLRFGVGSASEDGRYVVVEARFDVPGNSDSPPSAWLLDCETGARTLLARAADVLTDRYVGRQVVWDDEHPLRVLEHSPLAWRDQVALVEVEIGSVGAPSTRRTHVPLDAAWTTTTRQIPSWAHVERIRRRGSDDVTVVRWGERERRFDGPTVWPVRAVFPTPEPGVLLVVRAGELLRIDMASDEERVLLSGVDGWIDPSPDGSALLLPTEDAQHVLDSRSGTPLREPFSRHGVSVSWVDAPDSSRVLRLIPVGVRGAPTRVLDLDTGTEFEIDRELGQPLFLRLCERGYLYVRRDGDLVLTSLDGASERVLVDR
ncbi:MAG: hypothetical protein NTV21_20270 [Planctomycetota bacterium]|nr:hypothetical protein [Planctomycetota bacterium]